MINLPAVIRVLGILMVLSGGLMLPAVGISLYYNEVAWSSLLLSSVITMSSGALAMWFTRNNPRLHEIKKKDGYLIVSLGWLGISIFGALPFMLSGAIPSVADAFFETMSGFTTTGASILTDIEATSKGILFWRSTTQWIGGMGIIVLTIAILPLLGIGGMELFVAEAPGPTNDKLHPRIKETAKRLWIIYLFLTCLLALLLWMEGMSLYNAVNHAFTAISSGGYSTWNNSIAHYSSSAIHYTLAIFMIFAGTNFTLFYLALKGRFREVLKNEELRAYLLVIAGATLLLYGFTLFSWDRTGALEFREIFFMVSSILSTTGFVTADYTSWIPIAMLVFLLLMFSGAMAGSTSGGPKIIRSLMVFRNTLLEFKRLLHPRAVLPVRYNKQPVDEKIIFNIHAFIVLYLGIFAVSVFIMTIMGLDLSTAIGAVIACLGNIGPGIGHVGPVDNFAHIPIAGKWLLSILMMLGRLELFTVLIMFTPYFWQKR